VSKINNKEKLAIRELLCKWWNFKPTRRVPHEPKEYRVNEENEYREDEIAFVVGLENEGQG
jgi:hypothetical protein